MSKTYEADIFDLLSRRLNDATFSLEIDIIYEGTNYVPMDKVHVVVSNQYLPVRQISYGDTGLNRYEGNFNLLLNWPSGEGILKAKKFAGELITLFRRSTRMTDGTVVVNIDSPSYMSDPVETSGWISVPVTVRWRSDNPNVT